MPHWLTAVMAAYRYQQALGLIVSHRENGTLDIHSGEVCLYRNSTEFQLDSVLCFTLEVLVTAEVTTLHLPYGVW